jgi:hypothetical protein
LGCGLKAALGFPRRLREKAADGLFNFLAFALRTLRFEVVVLFDPEHFNELMAAVATAILIGGHDDHLLAYFRKIIWGI